MVHLPLLHRGVYAPLKEAFVACMNEVILKRSVNFSVGFYVEKHPVGPFFVQGFIPDGETIQLEVARQASYLPSPQVETNDLFMKTAGWSFPDVKEAENPNYVKRINLVGANLSTEAEKIIDASIAVGHLTPSTWMTFEPDSLTALVVASKTFWHNSKNSDLLCLPGQNIGDTKEGK